jgi:transcriptional regulator with XRE-family HTH domain
VSLENDSTDEMLTLGSRIRQFREEEGLSLRKLATLTGLSIGFLSQVERGLSSLALTSLRAVATALGRPLVDFFAEEAEAEPDAVDDDAVVFTLTRAADHSRRLVSGGRHFDLLSSRVPGLVLEPMLVYIEPTGVLEPMTAHAGEEFAYVLSGALEYEVAGTTHTLAPGDSLYLRSNTPHRMFNVGTETAVVVSVVTPRHY